MARSSFHGHGNSSYSKNLNLFLARGGGRNEFSSLKIFPEKKEGKFRSD